MTDSPKAPNLIETNEILSKFDGYLKKNVLKIRFSEVLVTFFFRSLCFVFILL